MMLLKELLEKRRGCEGGCLFFESEITRGGSIVLQMLLLRSSGGEHLLVLSYTKRKLGCLL